MLTAPAEPASSSLSDIRIAVVLDLATKLWGVEVNAFALEAMQPRTKTLNFIFAIGYILFDLSSAIWSGCNCDVACSVDSRC
mmetsp:Transcript_2852/g.4092  ORF Transcript_2852/g.4092 Transcript_2852/m.4092 type:complete len:82 (-) Transcript_2852:198-443(-)